jgi:rieske iron-sulfur protein
MLGLGTGSLVTAMLAAANALRPAERPATEEEQIRAGDKLVFALGTNKGKTITRGDLQIDSAVLAFPAGKESNQDNLVMLIHVKPESLASPTQIEWTADGFVAYSALCTHLGCTVSFSHESMPGAEFPHIHCPCHAGLFDLLRGARVMGGPPPRPLPQLPIQINEQEEISAAGEFTQPVGPD